MGLSMQWIVIIIYTVQSSILSIAYTGKVVLKCSQNGKLLTAQVKDISREDSLPLSASDLMPGASLLVEHKGKFYPVQFVRYKGNYLNVMCSYATATEVFELLNILICR